MEQVKKKAFQPFTFGGVARYAYATPLRVFAAALFFALLGGAVTAWCLARCFAPVIDEAVANLPSEAAIHNRTLQWPERSGRLLAANPFLSIEVVLHDIPAESAPGDFGVELHQGELSVRSILGRLPLPYPSFERELSQKSVGPLWGAWRFPLILAFGLLTAIALIACWSALAVLYSVPVRILAGLFNRAAGFKHAWKMSLAAQWTGAVVMTFALLLYSTGKASVLFVIAILAAHFAPTLLNLLISPVFLRRAEPPPKNAGRNPFRPGEAKGKSKKKNPFKGSTG